MLDFLAPPCATCTHSFSLGESLPQRFCSPACAFCLGLILIIPHSSVPISPTFTQKQLQHDSRIFRDASLPPPKHLCPSWLGPCYNLISPQTPISTPSSLHTLRYTGSLQSVKLSLHANQFLRITCLRSSLTTGPTFPPRTHPLGKLMEALRWEEYTSFKTSSGLRE